ncbi:hypothetical protein NP493_297g03005 [Ridgeia piscesae]|uniref:Fibronectin type-III domain-containing protein n=1 Tax=Ridgeia piscesae TaxID=27915 RepID=A0AAD9NWH6_RIDPI|nr:hypothetical protein NP493_297g03005 [Ridgeia piscesae]
MRGHVLNYTCELWRHGIKERSFTLPASATSYKFTNLMPYTNYTMRMGALARVGPGEWYEKRIRTLESAPSLPPASLTGYLKNQSQVFLSWRTTDAPNGVITKYEVFALVSRLTLH